jgi:hypothetical protein
LFEVRLLSNPCFASIPAVGFAIVPLMMRPVSHECVPDPAEEVFT